MKGFRYSTSISILILGLAAVLLVSCGPVDLNAPMPTFETGVDPDSWAEIPAGEFHLGQFDDIGHTASYEIMVTNVTVNQYADFLNAALADGLSPLPASGTCEGGQDKVALVVHPGVDYHWYRQDSDDCDGQGSLSHFDLLSMSY